MQIVFITLFLGLIAGPREVSVAPGAGVAAVEIVLDGQRVARMERAPWSATVDFGRSLQPHHLAARGFDARGGLAAEVEQWVNLPRPNAEVEIVLEGSAASRTRSARLVWDQMTGEQPEAVSLELDGAPLALDGRWRAALFMPQAGAAHVLSADVQWKSGTAAHRDVVLTGDWGSDVATELTAVAVRAAGRGRPLEKSELQGRLVADGQPLRVEAVEQLPPRVLFVKGPGGESGLRAAVHGSAHSVYGHFSPDSRIQSFSVSPFASRYPSVSASAEIFDIKGPLDPFLTATMANVLLNGAHGSRSQPPQIADAVAVAGLNASARHTPRAVVLIVGSDDGPSGANQFAPAAVRDFLAALGVPLFVWSIGRPGFRGGDEWGGVEDISTPGGLSRAYQRLHDEVLAQQIVWVEGRHLPQSVLLVPAPAAGAASLTSLAPIAPQTPQTPLTPRTIALVGRPPR